MINTVGKRVLSKTRDSPEIILVTVPVLEKTAMLSTYLYCRVSFYIYQNLQ